MGQMQLLQIQDRPLCFHRLLVQGSISIIQYTISFFNLRDVDLDVLSCKLAMIFAKSRTVLQPDLALFSIVAAED